MLRSRWNAAGNLASAKPSLNQLVRRQLHELRIDPDRVLPGPPPRRGVFRPDAWCRRHARGLLMAGVVAIAVLLVLGAIWVVSATLAPLSKAPQSGAPVSSVSVTVGETNVQVGAPSFRRLALGQALVILHLDVHNPTTSRLVLRSGDLLLVDRHGALFAPTWRDADGSSHDGLADPSHTLVGLDGGADVQVEVPFVVFGDGPFTLRYQRADGQAETPLPGLTLQPAT